MATMSDEPKPISVRELALDTAKKAICGDRNLNYGEPEDNFLRIARLWNASMKNCFGEDAPQFSSWHVALFLGQVKDARLAHTPSHSDSWVDKIGYAACGAEVSKDSGI